MISRFILILSRWLHPTEPECPRHVTATDTHTCLLTDKLDYGPAPFDFDTNLTSPMTMPLSTALHMS